MVRADRVFWINNTTRELHLEQLENLQYEILLEKHAVQDQTFLPFLISPNLKFLAFEQFCKRKTEHQN